MKTTAKPRATSRRISAPSSSAPFGVSIAVASSRTSTRPPRISARTISACCCSPSDSDPVTASGSTATPMLSPVFASSRCEFFAVRTPPPGPAERDVLGDAERRHQHHVLEHRADAQVERPPRRRDRPRRSVNADLAFVGMKQARQHADQGRLARPVLAEEDMHLARPDRQIDTVVGDHAGKPLGYADELDDGSAGRSVVARMKRSGIRGHPRRSRISLRSMRATKAIRPRSPARAPPRRRRRARP